MLAKGYEVYIVDQWSIGRSSKTNLDAAPSRLGGGVELAEVAFTAPEVRIFEPLSIYLLLFADS